VTTSRPALSRRLFLLRGWILAMVSLAIAPALRAQLQVPVLKIVITNIGPPAASESLIRANIRVKEGDTYNRASVDDDVRNLYATGYFYDIRVQEDRTVNGITLIYFLEGKQKLTDISFTGNKKFSTAKLRKKLTSKIGEPLDERKLFTDAQEIKKMYQKSGYPQTEVKYVPARDEKVGRATVVFEIKEAPKVKIEDVWFEGARAFSQAKLRKQLKTRRHWMFSWLTSSGVLKDEQLEEDKDKLAEFYREAGYIDFELKDLKYVYYTPRKLVLHFVISEGQRYRVGSVEFKGVSLFSTNELSRKLKMNAGEIFTPKALTKDLETIQDAYGAKGYIDTRVIPRKNPNTQTGTLDLVYEIEENDKSYIEKIEIKGNVKTKDRVIRRELSVAPGEIFDMVKVKRSKVRLEGTQLFKPGSVQAQPEPTDVPDRKNLVVSVEEGDTGHVSFGAGFSSVDSIVGFVEYKESNFDLINPPWFRGGGQKLRLRASVGTLRREYTLSFAEPWFLGKKLEFDFELYHRELNFVSLNSLYDERRTGGSVGLRRALGSDFFIGGVSYTLEDVGIQLNPGLHGPLLQQAPGRDQLPTVVPANVPQDILAEQGSRLVSKIDAVLSYDTRNSTGLPTAGQRTETRVEVAGGPLGGDRNFYKLELGSAWYFKGFFPGHVLELGARAASANSFGSTTNVPFFDRYFLGGVETLRGYRYREVGPRSLNEPIGGDTSWFASAEYSVPIIERLRFAAFYDIGMVYYDPFSFSHSYFGTGAYNDNWGIGLRLLIPQLGPLRLDYGIPIHSDPFNRSHGRFQFTAGFERPF